MPERRFYSHVNYSVTKIGVGVSSCRARFYSHVNYSVTKIYYLIYYNYICFTVT